MKKVNKRGPMPREAGEKWKQKNLGVPPEVEETMRTSLPHGMNQQNRIHPYFLILRKYAEREEIETNHLIGHTLGRESVSFAVLPFFFTVLLTSNVPAWVQFGTVALSIFTWAIVAYKNIKMVSLILNNAVFPKVNRMLASDDYQAADLNYENVFNLICNCADNLGECRAYIRQYKWGMIVDACLIVFFIAFIVIRRLIGW